MLATDRDSLECDLAETYGVLEMEALPVRKLAVLSFGLRDNSRIKMKLAGMKVSMDRLMLAGCFDMLSWLRWSKTDAIPGGGVAMSLMNNEKKLLGFKRQKYGVIDIWDESQETE